MNMDTTQYYLWYNRYNIWLSRFLSFLLSFAIATALERVTIKGNYLFHKTSHFHRHPPPVLLIIHIILYDEMLALSLSPHPAPLSSPQVPWEECHLQSNKLLEMFISFPIRSWGYHLIMANCDRSPPDLPTLVNPLTPHPLHLRHSILLRGRRHV